MSRPADESRSVPVLTEAMRAWRAAHPQATFAEIEVEATRQVAALRRELIAVAVAGTAPEEPPVCPDCGRAMGRNGRRTRTLITGPAERLVITGSRYRCSACGTELFPLGPGA